MSDSHLINTLNMIYRQMEDYSDEDGLISKANFHNEEYVEPMEAELKRRGLTTEEHLNFNEKLKKERERVAKLTLRRNSSGFLKRLIYGA